MFTSKHSSLFALLLPISTLAETTPPEEVRVAFIEESLIIGSKEQAKKATGSAHVLEESDLESFQYNDINQVLSAIPGVYIRQEDGFGLRPNIGIRGVTSERTQKVTLMEDGILITPAPYSAPAAYYVPNINRMKSVEVFKGPAAIEYGPHTVGGAINLVSKAIPEDREGEMSVSYGSYNQQKYNAYFGETGNNFGYLIEGLRYSSDGFKELGSDSNTGFVRNDVNVKLLFKTDDFADMPQRLLLKFGYADESSDETYLGISTEDFDKNPNRRYAASEKDHFDSTHLQFHAIHKIELSDSLALTTRAYINRFDRTWFRVSGMGEGAPKIADILSAPDRFPRLSAIIKGQRDSDPTNDMDTVILTNNAREYGSEGIESRLIAEFLTSGIEHNLSTGIRYHQDWVDRDQPQYGYLMKDGNLIPDTDYHLRGADKNRSEAKALALYLNDIMTVGDWTFNLGSRFELIDTQYTDANSDINDKSRSAAVFIPGAGAFYQWTDELGLLLGVNKGFSPAGANADESVDPEESINYEYGFRYNQDDLYIETIGFFSDYSNLIARCGFSETTCKDQSLNGGGAHIYGAEVLANYVFEWGELRFPISLTYTFTESEFQTSFKSSFSQWGDVNEGDELPYLPQHQLRFVSAIEALQWDLMMAINYIGSMREIAGQDGSITNTAYDEGINALTAIDLAAGYQFSDQWQAKLSVDNVFNTQQIVSRRSIGARPNKPLTAVGTISYRF